MTVVREGEITWPAPPIQVSAQPQAAAKKVEAPKEAVKPASPWRKYALMALAIKHSWHRAGLPFWLSIGVLAIVAVILWGYTRRRHLMDIDDSDFLQPRA
ncbi:hypothetical protein LAN13_21770, partial [Mycobacterium tuberculosis]|nr:hypothetical protein [Mycobacterium tuberculosis]